MKFRRMLCALLLAALLLGAALPARALESGKLMRVDNCKKWAALRADNTAKAKRLAKLTKGTLVVYGGITQGGFRLVRCGELWGYVVVEYLEEASRAVRTTKKVGLRSGPSDRVGRLKKLKKGATLLAVSDAENGYYRVCYDGLTGYVPAKYLRAALPKHGAKAVTLAATTVKSGSDTIARLPALAPVYCFGSDGDGHEYVYDADRGKYGFVDAELLLFAKKRRR